MSAATAGPWRFYTEPQPNGCPIVGDGRGLMVAMLAHSVNDPQQKAEAIANAKLIAAAPEMRDLLQSISNWLVCEAIATPEDMAQSFSSYRAEIDALIAKLSV